MSNDNAVIDTPPIEKVTSDNSKQEKPKSQKNIFLREIEVNSVKAALLKEVDISKLKESLIDDLKDSLLKEIDIKDLIGRERKLDSLKNSDSVTESKSEEASAPKKKVVNLPGYKYGLVDACLDNNKEILSIHVSIMTSAKDRDYEILPLMLSQFSKKCLEHFNEEEQLYTYVKALASSRSEVERKVAVEFSAEMKNVSIELFSVLNHSKYIPVNDNTVDGFLEEFNKLGDILKNRVTKEETILYPMYESSKQVVDIC